jgi:UDP-3-O-[3-hydroxymyristoyl] N-acetylglucosamine deacetylase / 3-hydroxyacyl-[acyl-carrier-protein] dehydratase
MSDRQRTIARPVSLSGVGLHTGAVTHLTFKPAPTGHGIAFVRTDQSPAPEIPADIDHVVDLQRGTTLAVGDVRIATVEHVLAAVAGLEIDNITVELDNVEPPVLDGSTRPFVDVLLEAGTVEQEAPRDYLEITSPISYSEPERGVDLVVLPSDSLRITFLVDYRNPALGTQYTSLVSLKDEFVDEFAPARTFCFLSELEELKAQNLIRGGRLDSAVVICDNGKTQSDVDRLARLFNITEHVPIGTTGILGDRPLRFPNEPVRHKAVDLIGDLALIGVPLKAHVLAARSGHSANVALARKIRELYQKRQFKQKFGGRGDANVVMDIRAILKIMPHRYPFLLIDRILDVDPGKRVVALKNVTINEPFFAGHFPDHPIMPGVLVLEAMAQAGGVLLLNTVEKPETKVVYFMGIDGARFRRPVSPGDQLRFELEMLVNRRGMCKMRGRATVDGELVTEADLMATVVDK